MVLLCKKSCIQQRATAYSSESPQPVPIDQAGRLSCERLVTDAGREGCAALLCGPAHQVLAACGARSLAAKSASPVARSIARMPSTSRSRQVPRSSASFSIFVCSGLAARQLSPCGPHSVQNLPASTCPAPSRKCARSRIHPRPGTRLCPRSGTSPLHHSSPARRCKSFPRRLRSPGYMQTAGESLPKCRQVEPSFARHCDPHTVEVAPGPHLFRRIVVGRVLAEKHVAAAIEALLLGTLLASESLRSRKQSQQDVAGHTTDSWLTGGHHVEAGRMHAQHSWHLLSAVMFCSTPLSLQPSRLLLRRRPRQPMLAAVQTGGAEAKSTSKPSSAQWVLCITQPHAVSYGMQQSNLPGEVRGNGIHG